MVPPGAFFEGVSHLSDRIFHAPTLRKHQLRHEYKNKSDISYTRTAMQDEMYLSQFYGIWQVTTKAVELSSMVLSEKNNRCLRTHARVLDLLITFYSSSKTTIGVRNQIQTRTVCVCLRINGYMYTSRLAYAYMNTRASQLKYATYVVYAGRSKRPRYIDSQLKLAQSA